MNTYFINPEDPQHEGVATLLTILMYPSYDRPDGSLDQRYREMCAYLIYRRCQLDPDWGEDLQPMRPAHMVLDRNRIMTLDRQLNRGVKNWSTAGQMALQFLKPHLPKEIEAAFEVTRLSKLAVAARVAELTQASSPENVLNRVYRPNSSVIHLCVVIAMWTSSLAKLQISGPGASIVDLLLTDQAKLKVVVQLAEKLEVEVITCAEVPATETNLIRFRWGSSKSLGDLN